MSLNKNGCCHMNCISIGKNAYDIGMRSIFCKVQILCFKLNNVFDLGFKKLTAK